MRGLSARVLATVAAVRVSSGPVDHHATLLLRLRGLKLRSSSRVATSSWDPLAAADAAAHAQIQIHPTSQTAAAAAVVADSWVSVLPKGKRAKLEAELKAAATSRERLDVVRKSLEGDTAKSRDTTRRQLLPNILLRLNAEEEGGDALSSSDVNGGEQSAATVHKGNARKRHREAAVATMLSKFARVATGTEGRSGHDVDSAELRKYTELAVKLSDSMNGIQIAQTLFALENLASAGVNVPSGAAQVFVNKAAMRTADEEVVTMMLTRFGQMAKKGRGRDVDIAELRKYMDAAANLSDSMTGNQIGQALFALEKLESAGVHDPSGGAQLFANKAAIRAANDETLVTWMIGRFGQMAKKGRGRDVDSAELRKYMDAAVNLSDSMTGSQTITNLVAFENLASAGVNVPSEAAQVFVNKAAMRAANDETLVTWMMVKYGQMAKKGRGRDVDSAELRKYMDAAVNLSDSMTGSQTITNLLAFENLASAGVNVPSGALQVFAEKTAMRAANEEVVTTMIGRFGQMAHKSDVDSAELRKYTELAMNLSDSMTGVQTVRILLAFENLASAGVNVPSGTLQVFAEKTAMRAANDKEVVTMMLTRFGRMAKKGRGHDVDIAELRKYTDLAMNLSESMSDSHTVSNLVTFGKLASAGVNVPSGAAQVFANKAAMRAGEMGTDRLTATLSAFRSLAGAGVDVDSDAVRRLVDMLKRSPHHFRSFRVIDLTLGTFVHMAARGMYVNPDTARACMAAAGRQSHSMTFDQVTRVLRHFALLASYGIEVDDDAARAIHDAAARVAEDFNSPNDDDKLAEMMSAFEKLKEIAARRDDDNHLAAVVAQIQTIQTAATAAAEEVADSWVSVLPKGKRAKLEAELKAKTTSRERLYVVQRSLEEDTAKSRDTTRRQLLPNILLLARLCRVTGGARKLGDNFFFF